MKMNNQYQIYILCLSVIKLNKINDVCFLQFYNMEMTYQGPRMRGAQTIFQEWSIPPLSSNQYWNPNDVIKIMGNITTGLIDFYRSHIQFQIQTHSDYMPVGGIQMDSSAASIINQLVVLSTNQSQVERIQQYDVLASALVDLGFSQYICDSRMGEGLGYSNIPTNLPASTSVTTGVQNIIGYTPGEQFIQSSTGSFSPLVVPYAYGTSLVGDTTVKTLQTGTYQSGINSGNIQSLTNMSVFPGASMDQMNNIAKMNGRLGLVRAQTVIAPYKAGYPDASYSLPITSPYIKNQNWLYDNMLTQGYDPKKPYECSYRPATRYPGMDPAIGIVNTSSCGVSGYIKPIGAQFCRGSNQPLLSPTIPQIQMIEGRILPSPIPLSRKTFRIPLISAICGILIPPDQFQLIPAQSVKNILLQITLNPYAFFTTGYSDVHQHDSYGMQQINMQKRTWRINNFQWIWHLYTMNDAAILGSIQQSLNKGILISSNYWQLSAQYQIPNGGYVRNSFQIPVNVQSLAQIFCIFISNQFNTYSFCRKQFRLSNNITSMQIKANGVYYPLQPIVGNAGNPQTVDTSGDNWPFYQTLLLSNNFLFNTNVPMPKINQKNFAINGRIYDVTNTATYMTPNLYNLSPANTEQTANYLSNITKANINSDTAMGQSWFHQNRYIGKAIFSYTFEPYGHSKGMITGLDTRQYRQFDVTFNTSPNNLYPNDETLMIFTRANVLVRYTKDGITVLGA